MRRGVRSSIVFVAVIFSCTLLLSTRWPGLFTLLPGRAKAGDRSNHLGRAASFERKLQRALSVDDSTRRSALDRPQEEVEVGHSQNAEQGSEGHSELEEEHTGDSINQVEEDHTSITSTSTSTGTSVDASSGHPQPASPSQLSRQRKHWWESEKALTPVLIEAEEQYKRNVRKQKAVLEAGNPPKARNSPPHGAPPGPSPFTFLDRMFVATYSCTLEARLGDWGDGGKWICLSHYQSVNEKPVVLSIGSNGDTSFETAVYKNLGVPSYTLDFSLKPAVARQVSAVEYIKFYPVGLSGSREREKMTRRFSDFGDVKFLTIPEVLTMIGHSYVDVFKIDCEGCENDVVRDMEQLYTRETVPFGQIQMEIHRCANVKLTSRLLSRLEDLGYRLFHAEINPYGAAINYWQYEVAYIHESLVRPRLHSVHQTE